MSNNEMKKKSGVKQLPKIENPEQFFNLPRTEEGQKEAKKSKYWRSLEVLNNPESKEVLDAKKVEFPFGEDQAINLDSMSSVNRRKFLALMTASGVFATTACTDYQDKGKIINYTTKPESVQPGVANYYASTLNITGNSWGILIKTREGRPIKLEGNPEHPVNQGKISNLAHSTIVNLYDPSRLKAPQIKGKKGLKLVPFEKTTWEDADKAIVKALNDAVNSGKEIAILSEQVLSPSYASLLNDFIAKYPTAKVYGFNTFNNDVKNAAWQETYNTTNLFPSIQIDKADVILSLENDFLGVDGDTIENTRMFVSRKDINNVNGFNKMYCVEGAMTLTGAKADYRFRLSPEMQFEFVAGLINEVIKKGALTADSSAFSSYSLDKFIKVNGFHAQKIGYLVDDLIKSKGKSIVLGGRHLPKATHIAINYLNHILGNTELYRQDSTPVSYGEFSKNGDFANLVKDMNAGKVGVLINIDTNPVFNLPADLNFADAIQKVNTVVTLSEQENESTGYSTYLLPTNHTLESWGDAHARSNVMSLQQPVISPLYDTREKEAMLLTWINGDREYSFDIYYNYVANKWKNDIYPKFNSAVNFETFWNNTLHDGVVTMKSSSEAIYEFNTSSLSGLKPSKKENYTVVFTESPTLGDGKYANNGFLQETPHPITKVTWDNTANISINTARKLDLKFQDMLELNLNGKSIKLPVVVQPGMADDLVQIDLGYGRTAAGDVGNEVGFNVNQFMTSNGVSPWIFTGAKVSKAEGTYKIASTQEHHQMDELVGEAILGDKAYKISEFHIERSIIQETELETYKKDNDVIARHKHATKSIMANHEYTGIKWAMAIDMNKCTGCNACITSCNVESNIPVVGKEEVLHGREMQWMRMDRYYSGDENNPKVSIQPMMCQHCDNAPCENVCPVVATTHSPDGINQMVYNRCVGTRYCANNCPYKVRRFNFYDFRDNLAKGYYYAQSMQQMYNPEVTIRSRGVMEKCDFCTSRIADAKSNATKDGREFKGSDVVTACQESCPANAIYFGDSNDPNSEVSKLRKHDLGYHVLEILDVKPNVTYIAKLNNVIPEIDNSEGHNSAH